MATKAAKGANFEQLSVDDRPFPSVKTRDVSEIRRCWRPRTCFGPSAACAPNILGAWSRRFSRAPRGRVPERICARECRAPALAYGFFRIVGLRRCPGGEGGALRRWPLYAPGCGADR